MLTNNNATVGAVRQAVEKFEGRSSVVIETSVLTRPDSCDISAISTGTNVAYALPSPSDTPYRTPSSSRSRSRQTSRTYDDVSPATTPPPLPSGERNGRKSSNESLNAAVDESLPLSDPRRFTPTLHASLVSEILSLRRDAEAKTKDIESLEQSVHDAQLQNQSLNANLLNANRETRQVKRQMQILEGGTLSAINELAKERDDALSESVDLRTRLDQALKKVKRQEDHVDSVQDQWQKDKDTWSAEKRSLETKIHIVEGRLKVVLSEVAKAQQLSGLDDVQSPKRSQSRTSMLGSPRKRPDSVTARRQSLTSVTSDHIGGRTSVMSFAHGDLTNLADELALEGIDEDSDHHSNDGRMSPDALPEESARPASRVSIKARKVLGLPIDLSDFEQTDRIAATYSTTASIVPESMLLNQQLRPVYVDSGVQYSRPSSPPLSPERTLDTPIPRNRESVDTARASKALSVVSLISQDSAQYSVDTSDNAWEENLRNQPIMVSSACQTIEKLPSPYTIPKVEPPLFTIDETVELREIAVQTDLPPPIAMPLPIQSYRWINSEHISTDLQIPTIAIIPPTSRPVTPDELAVKLPPRTKNAGCQVETHVLCDYNSKGMQTEEIRIDKRNVLPQHLILSQPPLPPNVPPPSSFIKTKTQSFSRRTLPNAPNSSMRRTVPPQVLPPINDDGPLSDTKNEIGRPVRSSSMFAGFDEGDDTGDVDDDIFNDDEFFDRPTTRLILSRGKITSPITDLDDIEESEAAIAAGKRYALEQIRRSEENERDFEVDIDSQIKSLTRQSTRRIKRVPSAPRNSNMRRTALISSGTAAHQAKSSLSSLGSGDNGRPPVPIPVRYSSARVGKSASDGGRSSRASSNTSPTRNVRRVMKSSLRKTRSGPALSPAARDRRTRSRSPPLDSRVEIVPEMPNFKMPNESNQPPIITASYNPAFVGSAPTPCIAQGLMKQPSFMRDGTSTLAAQQTSVVDAIAQTMVGEWMFKYVRRRKSFGKPEREWDPNKSVEEMSNSTNSGVRHKRWVWLAPYERSVMWSSKQPTDNTSLLGKAGRKLIIKSVLDVKDDNPMPKGSITGPHFNRSILILTPQRALKFTATTQERHYIWLTALSFLSHSPISMNDLAPMPPIPPEGFSQFNSSPTASLEGSLRRRPIRDSIRLAKDSNVGTQFRSFTTDGIPTMSEYDRPRTQEQYDPINDAALPPVVRRYHNRKRSNTAPKPTASAFRALISRDSGPTATAPSITVTSEKTLTDRGPTTPSLGIPSMPSMPSSRRGSEASALGRPILGPPIQTIDNIPRLFDVTNNSSHAASMTMKMDAFMADQQRNGTRASNAKGSLRNLRLARPSMRNLKDPYTSSWAQQEFNVRDSMSPVETNTLPTPTDLRFSESTGRGSSEAGGYFRGF